ncbi:MAG: hypothetical protein QM674_23675, partial [Burkholderiaceae bacterium]
SVWIASVAGRRFGHAISGVLAGLPMVAGPMVAVLMIDHDADVVAPIAAATVTAIPATLAFFVAFAHGAARWRASACLLAAAAAFFAVGMMMNALALPSPWAEMLALASPPLALGLMPAVEPLHGPVPIPRKEIVLRMLGAAAIGALILHGAGHFPPAVNGLLLSWPVTGAILPSFTLTLHGRVATINLLRGFANGLSGFAVFFCALGALLRHGVPEWGGFAIAIAAAVATAWGVHRLRARRRPPRAPSPPVSRA